METKDIFISHAHEDKVAYVYPLINELKNNSITYWLDEVEIGWGKRIIQEVSAGLISSKFVLVILTNSFLEKRWTQIELETALTTEINTGNLIVLPVLVASEKEVFNKFPLLNSKLYLRWETGTGTIADNLARLLNREFKEDWTIHHPAEYSGKIWIKLLKRRSNIEKIHRYSIEWGPWKFEGTIMPSNQYTETLVHCKGNDGLSVPIFFKISPPCYLSFGQGEPPSDNIVNINHGWKRVENRS